MYGLAIAVKHVGIVFCIKRVIETKHGKTEELSYYITSHKSAFPKNLIEIARSHWSIESMYWVLDVVFSEDDCGILSESGQKTMNTFRKFALAIHESYMNKQGKKVVYKRNMFQCLLNDEFLLEVISSYADG